MPYNLTTFDAALQAKLNTASVNLSAQDYLLLTKAVAAAIEVSEGVSLLSLKNSANGVAGLDSNSQIALSQMTLAVPVQNGNAGKFLTTNGTQTSWDTIDEIPSVSGNSGKLLTNNGTTSSWTATPSVTSLSASGDITVGDDIFVGPGAPAFHATLTDSSGTFVVTSGQDSYGQLAFKNTEPSSSSDIIAYSAEGGDAAGWIDMGITGATFDSATYGITGPHDGYIFMQAVPGTDGAGNLVIATGNNGTDNKIIFAAGGYSSGNTQMEITPDQNIHIEIPTPSTSPTTGALTVVGGVGIQGDMNINGDVSIQGTITFGGGGTTVETSNLAVTDPAVFVGTNNQADIVDLAFIGEYATSVSAITRTITNKALTNNVATLTTGSAHTYLAGDIVTITGVDATFNGTFNIINVPTTTTFTYAKTATNVTSVAVSPAGSASVTARRKFAGIARDASDGIVKVFKDATSKPTSTINFSEAGLGYADFRVAGLTASSANITSATIGSVTNTEIGYLSGVTSSIQTQINSKLDSSTASSTYLTQANATSTYLTQANATSTYLTQSNATSTYLTQSNATSTYTPLLVTTATPTFSSNNYTLVLGDAHKVLLASNGSTAGTVTIPLNSSVAFTIGTTITISQTGSGQLTLSPTGGVTINSYLSQTKFAGQYASVQLIKTGTDTWLAVGNLTA